jgi:rubrerythrin
MEQSLVLHIWKCKRCGYWVPTNNKGRPEPAMDCPACKGKFEHKSIRVDNQGV